MNFDADNRVVIWGVLSTILILSLSLLVNVETVRTFPSWFDEAFMANVSFNLARGEGRLLDLIPELVLEEVNMYGPLFFSMQAQLIDWFGLEELAFRLPNLVAAYAGIFVLAYVMRRHGVQWRWCLTFVLAALVDISVNRNLVSGRMDMLAVLFALIALLFASSRFASVQVAMLRWVLIGGFSALAYLTTPRSLFLLPVVAVVALADLYREFDYQVKPQVLISLAIAFLAFSIPIWVWVLAVGGFSEYAAVFTESTTLKKHIGPSFFRSSYDNVGIIMMIVLAALNARRLLRNELILGLLSTYLAFSLFVQEIGPYAGMIMPFVLATIVALLGESQWRLRLKASLATILVLPGLLLISLRAVDLMVNAECREPTRVSARADKTIGGRVRIIAPFKYYFLLESPARQLTTFERSKVDRETMIDQAQVVLTSHRDEVLDARGFKLNAELSCSPQVVPLLPATFLRRSTFNELIYLREDN